MLSCVTVAGYSTSVGEKNNAPLYFAGAPRFEHTGQVVLFRHDGKNWIVVQRINGDQVSHCLEKVYFFFFYLLFHAQN